jgi:tetratricopeptide (TPR) repeat protein
MHYTKTIGLFSALLLLAGCAAEPPKTPPTASVQPTSVVPLQPVPVARPRATGTLEDARRHMVRGSVAVEMAKSDTELALAEDEYRMATEIAPKMADAWFNLGTIQARIGHYDDAMASYKEYLSLAPDAADAPRIRDDLIKLEFRQEQQAKTQGRVGVWIADDGTYYGLSVDGNHIILKASQRHVSKNEVISTYTLVGNVPVQTTETVEYQLTVQGNSLSGLWTRSKLAADQCTIPSESTETAGELQDAAHSMVLHHTRTSYRAATQLSLSKDYCREVVPLEKMNIEERLYGPLPSGIPDVGLEGLYNWWDGGFSTVQFGWQGRLAVRVADSSVAYSNGLRDKDEILAINGTPVSSLTAGQAIVRLRGEPGTSVSLSVIHKGSKEPLSIMIQRVYIPIKIPGM